MSRGSFVETVINRKVTNLKKRFQQGNKRFTEINQNLYSIYTYVVTQRMHSYDICFITYYNNIHLDVFVAVATIGRVF
jgi:hypothetical protein